MILSKYMLAYFLRHFFEDLYTVRPFEVGSLKLLERQVYWRGKDTLHGYGFFPKLIMISIAVCEALK